MAIIESKGNGYSLFKGMKLPHLPEWDKATYPYAFMYFNSKGNIRLSTSTGLWSANEYWCSPESDGVSDSYKVEDGLWVPIGTEKEYEAGDTVNYPPVWSNYDMPTTGDPSSIFLAASESISLDGMNVIEWDGDTTGLTVTGQAGFGANLYAMTDFHAATNAIVYLKDEVYGDVVCTNFKLYGDGWWQVAATSTIASLVVEAEGDYLSAVYYDNTSYVTLIAYQPSEPEQPEQPEEPEEPEKPEIDRGKLFLLYKIFSPDVFYAITGKKHWAE